MFDECNFPDLDDAHGKLDEALDHLAHPESVLDAVHSSADLLQGIGDAISAVTDGSLGTCMSGIGDELESHGEPYGEVVELVLGVVGEGVEAISEISLGVSDPLVHLVGEAIHDLGDVVDLTADSVENLIAGDIRGSVESAMDILHEIPDLAADVASAVGEIIISVPFEGIEGLIEVSGELVEGGFECLFGDVDDDQFTGGKDQ